MLTKLMDLIAWISAWSGFHLATVELLTAAMSLGGGVVILLLRRQVLDEERWILYFGWAFIVFGVQYLPQAFAVWSETTGGGSSEWVSWIRRVAHGVASPANNLLFLACANALLGYEHHTGPRSWLIRSWFLSRRKPIEMLPVSKAAWLFALITLVSQLCPDNFGQRLPDALFSAVCLGKLGWAMFLNFSPRRRPIVAWSNLLGGGLYGLVNLLYCLNPLIVESYWLATSLEKQLQSLPLKNGESLKALQAVDGSVVVAAFFLKMCLFLGALLLIMKCLTLLSPRETQEEFGPFRDQRIQQSVVEGMVNALGRSTAADHVAVYFRLPGAAANKIFLSLWKPGFNPKRDSRTVPMPMLSKEALAAQVFMKGKEICTADRDRDPDLSACDGLAEETRALVVVPVRYQGAVIGCLHLEWESPRSFTATAVQRIRYVADLVVPMLAMGRQLQALDQLSWRLHEVGSNVVGLGKESLAHLLHVVQDVLAPTATGLRLAAGFRPMVMVYSDSKGAQLLPETVTASELQAELRLLATDSGKVEAKPEIHSSELRIQAGRLLGQLIGAVPGERDPRDRPSLVGDPPHLRTVASLVADTLLELAQRQLNACLLQLQARMSSPEALSPQGWWAALEATAKEAGLLWLVAELPIAQTGESEGLLGREEEKAWVSSARAWPAIDIENLQLRVSPPDKTVTGQPLLLRLKLTAAQGHLWLGVAQPQIQEELEWPSPWKRFLPRLADAADAAWLHRQRRLAESQAASLIQTASRVEATRLWMHEGGNLAAKFLLGTEGVERALRQKWHRKAESRLADLKQVAERFSRLAAAFKKPNNADVRIEIPLHEPMALLQNLHKSTLKGRLIELEVDISPDLRVAMPFEVTLLALNELVTNATDALQNAGLIQIEAEDTGAVILCHVTNTGPEVDSSIRDHLFEPGTTTKTKGGGWGLAETRSALHRYGGGIVLDRSHHGDTRFTIRFPKPYPSRFGV